MQIIHGDCLAFLATIPADSLQSCVTSPPYYGLRDYLTGSWVGGDPDCEHRKADPAKSIASSGLHRPGSSPVGHRYEGYRSICRRCGAKRVDQQIGLEDSIAEYVEKLVQVFREVRRVLRPDGTLWLVLGDSYSDGGRGGGRPGDKQFSDRGSRLPRFSSELPPKNLLLMPARVALALQADGWILRNAICWEKASSMPQPAKDRCTASHEYVFLFAKRPSYFYDRDAIAEPAKELSRRRYKHPLPGGPDELNGTHTLRNPEGMVEFGGMRNARDVWHINPRPYRGAHFATFPVELAERCIKAGTSEHGCCASCGAPWQRVTETVRASCWEDRKAAGHRSNRGGNVRLQLVQGGTHNFNNCAGGFGDPKIEKTVGWQPTCKCNAPIVACMVLDPFGGSGTTGEAALKLGRDVTLIELNGDYVTMIERRLEGLKTACGVQIRRRWPAIEGNDRR